MLAWLSLLSFLSFFPVFQFFFCGAVSGCLSVFQVHLLIFLGPPFVFISRAFINPMWTLIT